MADMSMRIRAGRLRQRVLYETRTLTQDASGQSKPTFTGVSRWAQVTPITGDEAVSADQNIGNVSHEVTMRWQGNESPRDRIVHDGRTLEIRRILDIDERRKKIVALCNEVAG